MIYVLTGFEEIVSLCFCSENEGEKGGLKHNHVTLTVPLKYEVMLTVHG